MLKRNAVLLVIVGLILAGGAAAVAAGGPERPSVSLATAAQESDPSTPPSPPADAPKRLTDEQRAALRTCMEQATDDAARRACFAAAGLPDRPMRDGAGPRHPGLTEEQRTALKACMEQATTPDARRACFTAAGLPEGRPGPHGPGGPGRPGPGGAGHLGALGRAVHGEVRVPDDAGGWQDVTFDKGKVAAATDATKVVLERPDGKTVTLAVNGDTKFHGVANAEALVDGKPAMVISKNGTATQVHQMG